MDGSEDLHNVTIIATTYHADMRNEAVLRSGRIWRYIYGRPLDAAGRKQIFEVYLSGTELILT
jgi:transitional endoplasmic reticulum ATPase